MDWRPKDVLQLETQNFTLASMTPENISTDYIKIWNDEIVQKGLNSRARNWTRQKAIKHVKRFDNKHNFHLGIFTKTTGRFIGFCTLFVHVKQNNVVLVMAFNNGSEWRKGKAMLESAPVVMDFIFNTLAADKIKAEILAQNTASIGCTTKLGFTLEGVLKSEVPYFLGGRADKQIFGLTRDDWSQNVSPRYKK